MNLVEALAKNNECYLSGRIINPTGIVVHSIGCEQPDARVFVRTWNVAEPNGSQVCVHAFISGVEQSTVYQLLPWIRRSWGCGGGANGSYNDSHIQFECCEPTSGAYVNGILTGAYDAAEFADYFKNIYDTAVDLCVKLVGDYPSISVDNIVSHAEASAQGYASNHSDVGNWWKYHNVTMDDFRASVRAKLSGGSSVVTSTASTTTDTTLKVGDNVTLKDNAKQYDGNSIRLDYMTRMYQISELRNDRAVLTQNGEVVYAVNTSDLQDNTTTPSPTPAATVVTPIVIPTAATSTDFQVQVTTSVLNIRSGPGTANGIVGAIRDMGCYTIVGQDSTQIWGKLKSGAGWIHLGYTKRV